MFDDFLSDDDAMLEKNLASVQLGTPDRQQHGDPLRTFKVTQADHDPVLLLRTFYQRLFPYKTFYSWLNYSNAEPTKTFTHREFSFTLANDIYIRFQSFNDLPAFKKEIERLQPVKMDLGAIYTIRPKERKTVNEKAFRPLEKEFVLDIDMTDYDEIRTCCTGGDICHKCWTFMTLAIKVIDACLRDDFGFQHILWVYSGRRGVHCWVSDERARQMDNESRKAVIGYMEVIKGGAEVQRKVKLMKILHPSLERSYKTIEPYFESLILDQQGVLDTKEEWTKMVSILSDANIRDQLNNEWSNNPSLSGAEKWDQLVQAVHQSRNEFDSITRDIQLQYLYPRLDSNVSTNINHLLKSPFCVHPKTQRVCVPIDPENCDNFDPLAVPTLMTLNDELNKLAMGTSDSERKIPDYKKTSLKPYIDIFENFVNGLLKETQRAKRDQPDHSW
ncbi:putative DNA primase small subunit [Hesseltinella vesiculosa]|uniref:DNA primase n=1 Tax=Hesseltinella vesiculosa TaxID=101127 RepID=A0A1X2GP72_9FUNG|nr:putative DNA primase small subunit [Hesseltinella vesiculosa]